MAESQRIAARSAQPGGSAAPARWGVTHVRAQHPDRFTIVGNHLAQHRELSLVAIGVGTHILSLPEGSRIDIRTLAERFPEGRDRIGFALRELEAHGYVRRVRERTEAGRWVTRTYVHHLPLRGREFAPAPAASAPVPAPAAAPTPVPAPVADSVSEAAGAVGAPEGEGEGEGEDGCEGEGGPGGTDSDVYDAAVRLLAALRRTDSRLTLSVGDVRGLAPQVVTWFERGVGEKEVRRILTEGLPSDGPTHPAGLLSHRLRTLLPPPLPDRDAPLWVAEAKATWQPLPFQDCDGCGRVFRSAAPGRCGDCCAGVASTAA